VQGIHVRENHADARKIFIWMSVLLDEEKTDFRISGRKEENLLTE
jgi:hypothetical protein